MTRLARPLDRDAVQAADDEIYARHAGDPRPNALYDADGNRQPLSADDPSQAGLRREWVELYRANLDDEDEDPDDPGSIDDPVQPCPNAGCGSLVVRVIEQSSGEPVEGADVRISGPSDAQAVTDAEGLVTFECIPAGFYDLEAARAGFTGATGLGTADVPESTTSQAELVLRSQAVIEIVEDHDNDHAVDAGAPVLTTVRFGLWDHAFDPGPPVALKNAAAEADNFVGADSRRFYFRVRDPAATDTEVEIEWKARKASGADETHTPATKTLTLVENPAGSKVFVSKAVMLVTDQDDLDQATDSGFPIPRINAGQRNRGQSDHRLRFAELTGRVRGEYAADVATIAVELPVFRLGSEPRRRVPLQIFVMRVAAGGAPVTPTGAGAGIWTRDMRVLRETYARIGMAVETVVAPGTPAADIKTQGRDSVVEIDPPAGVNPANISFADETTIGTAHPALADTIRVFFVAGLASGNGGETWSDAIAPVGNARRGTVFTIFGTGPYAATHEVGHALTDKRGTVPTDGHFRAPAATPRLTNDQNLMKREFLGAEGVLGAKRLWDENDADGFNQFDAARTSHYTRPF